MRRSLTFAVVAALAVTALDSVALAAPAPGLCLGRASQPVTAPNAHGRCKKGQRLIKLATQTQLTTLQTQNAALAAKVSSLQSANGALGSQVASLQSANSQMAGELAALQATLSKVSYSPSGPNGFPTLTIAGANLQIVSGSGKTDGTTNGLGNLIMGYDESSGTQTGSHNIVLGLGQTFTSYGGLIGGFDNNLSGPFSDVFGAGNTVSGQNASVTGGESNKALAEGASVMGGTSNTAANTGSSVGGGSGGTASGVNSTVSGGFHNTASAANSAILGGDTRTLSIIEDSEAGPTVFGP
jgi:hypothetical protein